jgi:hypothetical protein
MELYIILFEREFLLLDGKWLGDWKILKFKETI